MVSLDELDGADTRVLVSIIMPTYNRSHLLQTVIQGILRQTVSDFELLICDDGSTDDTELQISQLPDNRIHYYKLPHSGLPAVARNYGLAHAQGVYLAFIDDDDLWLPRKLEVQLEMIRRQGTSAAAANAFRVSSLDDTQNNTPMFLWNVDRITLRDMIFRNPLINSSVIFHRDLLSCCGRLPEAPDLRAMEDYALFLRIAFHTDFSYSSQPLLCYLDAPKSSIRKGHWGKASRNNLVFEDFRKHIPALPLTLSLKFHVAAVWNHIKDFLKLFIPLGAIRRWQNR